jgi:hypothetical protein
MIWIIAAIVVSLALGAKISIDDMGRDEDQQ